MNYIRKDPAAPCSLTEALEFLQVDVLEDLITKDSKAANQRQPPKNKPHNFTVVAMEGCHSFIILDWARPLKDDMVSGKKCEDIDHSIHKNSEGNSNFEYLNFWYIYLYIRGGGNKKATVLSKPT